MAQHFEEADHRDVPHVGEKMGSFPLEVIAPEAEDLEVGPAGAQVAHELTGVQIAGRLAARDEQPPAGRAGHGEAV
jgi:hypothetical protein